MSLTKLSPLSRAFVLTTAFFAVTVTASATVRVGGASLRANGQLAQGFQYTGSCPVALKFSWGVISTEPTTIQYTFVRSDGGHETNSLSANLPGGGHSTSIYDDWQLGANTQEFQNFRGWVELRIESPNPVNSKIAFTIHCTGSAGGGAAAKIGGSSLWADGQLAPGHQHSGSYTTALKLGCGVIATDATTITDSFVCTDHAYMEGSLTASAREMQKFSAWTELHVALANPVAEKVPLQFAAAEAERGWHKRNSMTLRWRSRLAATA